VSSSFVPRFTLVELAFALSACTPRPGSTPLAVELPAQPVMVAIADDAGASPIEETGDAAAFAPQEVFVPPTWDWLSTETSVHAYSVSISNGDWARSKVDALLSSSDAGLGITPAWFADVNRRAEDMSSWYAHAFRAPNATPEEKVAVVLTAAESALRLAKRLDDAGLGSMPKTWRADPSLAVTFEDVSMGPAKRWREEGLALVQLCIEAAFDTNVHNASTKKCQALRKAEGTAVIRRAYARGDAGAQGCRCAPGDPLCSEPMTWCARR
jgi:hypothetical protein